MNQINLFQQLNTDVTIKPLTRSGNSLCSLIPSLLIKGQVILIQLVLLANRLVYEYKKLNQPNKIFSNIKKKQKYHKISVFSE